MIIVLGLNCGLLGPTLQGIAEDNSASSPIERSLVPLLFAENTESLKQKLPQHQPECLTRDSNGAISVSSSAAHAPISISSNAEFAALGFPGAGTIGDPYRIEELNITNSTGPLITIRDTSAYFRINGNLLNGLDQASWGISFSNVIHGTIEHNIVGNTTNDGIRLNASTNNIVSNNTVYNNKWAGIRLEASGNTISNNRIYDNAEIGIYFESSFNNTVTSNVLTNNGFCGLQLWFSGNNTLSNNTIAYHTYGALLLSSYNNTVRWNDFFQNNLNGTSQAFDDGSGNTFTSNYWDDWTGPDDDDDGIVDSPYAIAGSANQQDLSPVVTPSATTQESPPNGENGSNGFEPPFLALLGLLILLLLVLSLGLGYILVNSQSKKNPSFDAFIQAAQLDFLEAINYKIHIALENANTELITEAEASVEETALVGYFPPDESVAVPGLDTVEQPVLTDYFPPTIRHDLKSGMKGRTVLTLIEIAYQYPDGTNPMTLSKLLNISPASVSNEIKRLTRLQYIESYVSAKALQDGRYRYYSITPKGSIFLQSLKGALDITISRLRKANQEN